MKLNIFEHRMNIGQDGRFFNLPDTLFPSLGRAAAIAELLEVACESGSINSFDPDSLQRASQAIRLEIRDAESLIDAYLEETRSSAQVETLAAMVQIGEEDDYKLAELAEANAEGQFVINVTNWANYSLDACGNRYRYTDKATQEILLQFVADSDDEAEEICMDFLRRRGMQAKKKKPD